MAFRQLFQRATALSALKPAVSSSAFSSFARNGALSSLTRLPRRADYAPPPVGSKHPATTVSPGWEKEDMKDEPGFDRRFTNLPFNWDLSKWGPTVDKWIDPNYALLQLVAALAVLLTTPYLWAKALDITNRKPWANAEFPFDSLHLDLGGDPEQQPALEDFVRSGAPHSAGAQVDIDLQEIPALKKRNRNL